MPSPDTPNHYPLELSPPDISQWRDGNTGIPYVWSFGAERPGPHVAVTAVVHGNELCGAIVVDELLRSGLRPQRGTLTLGFMNVEAFLSYDPAHPNMSRFVDEDFNRLWAHEVLEDSSRASVELSRARAVRPIIHEVDVLLDIHSMQQMSVPLMMAGPVAKGRELARRVGNPATIITDSGHPQGKRMRDYAPFIDVQSDRNALLVECGQHWEAGAAEVALDCALRFLRVTGTIDDRFRAESASGQLPPPNCFEVTDVITIRSDTFSFTHEYTGGEVIPEAGTLLAIDGDTRIATPYANCLLVMPSRRMIPGQTAVRLARQLGESA